MDCDRNRTSEVGYLRISETLFAATVLGMNRLNDHPAGSRILGFLIKLGIAVRSRWLHRRITPAAERIDRIRNPNKYLSQVNPPENS